MLIPVWLNIDVESIRGKSPSLADIVAIRADLGVDSVAAAVVDRIRGEQEITTITLLPSTVSAVGYFENLLRPVLRLLSDDSAGPTVTDTAAGKSFSPKRWRICIVAPDPAESPSSHRRSFAQSRGLTTVTLSSPPLHRDVYMYARIENDDVTFYDYPITLDMAYAAIDFSVDQKNHPLTADQLKRIEKANFKKTLRRLVLDRCGSSLSDAVEIE